MNYGPRLTEKQNKALKIKEAFAILTQGVEMIHYEAGGKAGKLKSSKIKKIIWMDTEILRLCCDTQRPTLAERAKGKVPPGIFMRDIAEVRLGYKSYDFLNNSTQPLDPECCISLIATERTLSLELPSKFACDWFHERLALVADDILTDEERRDKFNQTFYSKSAVEAVDHAVVDHLSTVLVKGVQVLHHHSSGRVLRSILTVDAAITAFTVEPVERTFFGFSVARPTTLKLSDVVEIRPGTHSFGFVGTNSTDKHAECMAIIGTECTIDLQLSNQSARDIFASKLRSLILFVKSSVTSEDSI